MVRAKVDRVKSGEQVGKNRSRLEVGAKTPKGKKETVFPPEEPRTALYHRDDWTEFRDINRLPAKAGAKRS